VYSAILPAFDFQAVWLAVETSKNSDFGDEAQEAAQRMTRTYQIDRQGMSEHATRRFAPKMNF
jgi:hypothetical protein